MLTVGLVGELIEWLTLILWIVKGIWIPFVIGIPFSIGLGIWVSKFYFNNIVYICPECHTRFQPRKMETLLANHNPKMRKLTCPSCRRKIWSLEVYRREVDA